MKYLLDGVLQALQEGVNKKEKITHFTRLQKLPKMSALYLDLHEVPYFADIYEIKMLVNRLNGDILTINAWSKEFRGLVHEKDDMPLVTYLENIENMLKAFDEVKPAINELTEKIIKLAAENKKRLKQSKVIVF